uniref:Sepiapterin reductase n=1 Tax=Ascaris suum TaxID=6253 RepID=F1L6Z5_ASCSU
MTLTGRKVFSLITGASRGIGREIAVQLSKKVANGSSFLITARDATRLEQLKTELLKNNCEMDVHIVISDLADLNAASLAEMENAISAAILKATKFDALLLVHNAGTIGDIKKRASEISSAKDWRDFLQINLIAMIQINNLVLRKVTAEVADDRVIVNITSLFAVKSFPSFSQYSVAKAAREAFFRSLAVEDSSLRILNYSPGPVQTSMYDDIATNSYDDSIRSSFKAKDGETTRKALLPEETVTKMISVLEANVYESGARVDFFDD